MAYPYTYKLQNPLKEWKLNGTRHREKQEYGGVDWGWHLGQDSIVKPGTAVNCIGKGVTVYSSMHSVNSPPKEQGQKGSNWGNIIIIAHKNPRTKKIFYSLYGHLKNRLVQKGDGVQIGQKIGEIAAGWTKNNGWWKIPHLHFAIYTGPWKGKVLPGAYHKNSKRTKIKYCAEPVKFIKNYIK